MKLPFQFFCTTQSDFRSRCSVKIRPLRKHEVWHVVKSEPEDVIPLNLGSKYFELLAVQKHYCRQESKHFIFSPNCGIQCSIPSKICPLRKRLPLSCHKNSSQIFDATKLWKHTIPLTYNTKTLISNISETHRFSPQMRLIAYPDHKTTHKEQIT